MSANPQRESATIYMFPAGGRARSPEAVRKARFAAEIAALRVSNAVCSDSWYHEEAVREAAEPAKH